MMEYSNDGSTWWTMTFDSVNSFLQQVYYDIDPMGPDLAAGVSMWRLVSPPSPQNPAQTGTMV